MAAAGSIDPRLQYSAGSSPVPVSPVSFGQAHHQDIQRHPHHPTSVPRSHPHTISPTHPQQSAQHSQLQQPQPYYLPDPDPTSRPRSHSHPLQLPHLAAPLPSSVDDSLEHSLADDDASLPDSLQDTSPTDDGKPHSAGLGWKPPDGKRPRACDSCRGLKVKCIIDPSSGQPCKRCSKAGRQCIVTPPTRKRQKKADSRVAELERKIDALTATLAQREASAQNAPRPGKRPSSELDGGHAAMRKSSSYPFFGGMTEYSISPTAANGSRPNFGPDKRLRLDSEKGDSTDDDVRSGGSGDAPRGPASLYNQRGPIKYDHSYIDEKVKEVVDDETAERLFNRYLYEVMPHFPAVPFKDGTTASEVRKEKPILFLAIMSGTSYGADIPAEIQVELERALRDCFATHMWRNGEKSLELIQALQVSALWYRPPLNFDQHMYYQMVHMSAIMAVDIGIGRRQNRFGRRWVPQGQRGIVPRNINLNRLPDPNCAEVRRAWIVSYLLCITAAMVLRRPILVHYNEFMRESIEYLENAEDALPSDKILCQHVKVARICEDIAIQFAMDDPCVNLSISDGKVTYGIKHHEQGLEDIMNADITCPALQLSVYITNLYLHEIALHSQNNVAEFKTAITDDTFRPPTNTQPVLGPHHVEALLICQDSCISYVETFLAIEFDVLYALPVIYSVRIIYAIVVLIKLYIASTSPGEMSHIIKKDSLHIEEYLVRLQQAFQSILDRDQLSPHAKFCHVIKRLNDRYNTIKLQQAKDPANREGDDVVDESDDPAHNRSKQHPTTTTTSSSSPSSPNAARAPRSVPPGLSAPPLDPQAQGLHLLSEAAVAGTPQPQTSLVPGASQPDGAWVGFAGSAGGVAVDANGGHHHPHHHQHHHQHQHQHHQHHHHHQHQQQQQQQQAAAYHAHEQFIGGYDTFDYGLGGLGIGVDSAFSGVFMGEGLWAAVDSPGGGVGSAHGGAGPQGGAGAWGWQ